MRSYALLTRSRSFQKPGAEEMEYGGSAQHWGSFLIASDTKDQDLMASRYSAMR